VTQAVYPHLARLSHRADRQKVDSLLLRAGLLLLLIGSISLPVIFLCRDFIVRFALSGQDPAAAALILPLAAGGFVWQLALLAHKPLELANRTTTMLVIMIAAVALKCVLNFWMLPRWGLIGAAFATLLAGLCYCALCLLAARSKPVVIS
jgi:O-antigen/teichoic acid export membrane protein